MSSVIQCEGENIVVVIFFTFIVSTHQWCLFSYPCYFMSVDRTAICGIDRELGAKIFPFRCMLHQSNACNNTKYKPATLRQCLHRNPKIVEEFAPELVHKLAIINQRQYKRHLMRILGLYAVMGNIENSL